MDFDLNDPLESDDSFFEEPKMLAKRSSVLKTSENKSLESIFGLTEKSNNENKTKISENKSLDRILGRTERAENKSKPSVTFEQADPNNESKKLKDDWLMGDTTPSNIAEKLTKKTDFSDVILSSKPKTSIPERNVSSLEDILRGSNKAPIAGSKVSSSLKDNNTPVDVQDVSSLTTIVGRRKGRRGSSTGVEDNLGLGLINDDYLSADFHTEYEKGSRLRDEEIQSEKEVIPNWLSGSVTNIIKHETTPRKAKSFNNLNKGDTDKNEGQISSVDNDKSIEKMPPKDVESTSSVAVDQFSLRPQQMNMNIQNTYASLNQQESLLLVTLQLKKYEDSLMEIKRQQQEILIKQETQFHTLVDEYMMKQQMVENNIKLQQERINNQIQMLISSSPMIHGIANGQVDVRNANEVEGSELPEIVRKLKHRHDEEMFMMEESFRKQLDIAQQSNSVIEEKLQNELKNFSQILEDNNTSMKSKYEEELSYYKDKIKIIEEHYKNEIEILKEKHAQQLREMKEDHITQIDYIKDLMKKESEILKNSHMFTQKIDRGIELLTRNTKTLHEMEEKVTQEYDVLTMARENSIESKEKEIILMRGALQKSREAAENERAQLLGLVRNLEIKLAEQSANGQEDRWALQQATATLTARATAIEREAEYNKSVLEREREELKTLKESLLAEQERMIMRLTEEKLQLSSDRARFETSSKITNTFEIDKMKSEAETAITVAKELTEKVDQERHHLYRQRNELEFLRRNLIDREKELDDRENEIDSLVQDAQRKLKEDKKVLIEAKKMEIFYKERMRELQNECLSLNDREKKLSEEKLLLSKERLALYTSLKKASTKSCALCKPAEEMLNVSTMRLRLEKMDDEQSEVSKEESNSIRVNEYSI